MGLLRALVCLGLAAGLLTLAAFPALGQEQEKKQTRGHPSWAPSLEKGLEQAKERGCALVVILNMDNERGNQAMVDSVYSSNEFHDAAKSCVIAIGSLFEHPKKGVICSRFGSVTCAQHQAVEKVIREDWLKRGPKDDLESPRHFFLAPNGKILFSKVWTMRTEDLCALMTRASELCTPERLAAWDTLEGKLERATDPIPAVREIALGELIGLNDPEVDAKLIKMAKASKDPLVTGNVLAAFALADDAARRKLSHAALSHKAPEVRMLVAYAMERSGKQDHLKPLLARAPKDRDRRSKGAIYRALGTLGKDAEDGKKVRTVLLKGVNNSKDPARDHAAVAIAHWAAVKAVRQGLQKILPQGGSIRLRQAASWSLGYSKSDLALKAVKGLEASLGKWDWKLRNTCEAAIAKLEGKEVQRYETYPNWFLPNPALGGDEEEEENGRGK